MIESPCVHICVVENGCCVGCKRTLPEIAKWSRMTNEEKQKVLDRISKTHEKKEEKIQE
jgi:hypothetical protein